MQIQDKKLACNHCGGGRFNHRRIRLAMDWAILRTHADLYICCGCGMLHWFVDPPEYTPDPDIGKFRVLYPPGPCPECGVMIGTNQAVCDGCGFDRGKGGGVGASD